MTAVRLACSGAFAASLAGALAALPAAEQARRLAAAEAYRTFLPLILAGRAQSDRACAAAEPQPSERNHVVFRSPQAEVCAEYPMTLWLLGKARVALPLRCNGPCLKLITLRRPCCTRACD